MNHSRMRLANNIVYFRLRNNWSQEELAHHLQSSASYVSEMERGKRNISVDYIDVLAKTFKVEPRDLLTEHPPVNNTRVKRHRR